jgi:hypothetical protein
VVITYNNITAETLNTAVAAALAAALAALAAAAALEYSYNT